MLATANSANGDPMELDMKDETNFLILLRHFYSSLFPFNEYFKWLSYGEFVSKNYFTNREFSFTLPSDAYIRFQSFSNGEELKKEILRLCPVKIDIGAVYNMKPKDKKLVRPGAFVPLEKEMVFDIDMTDYDEIRTCCSGGDVCMKCWPFMTISIKIIDRALREDFGFKHLLWIYSGRRGVHCWVCDSSARKLSQEERRAIVNYLELVKGGDQQARKVTTPPNLHPSLYLAKSIVDQYFDSLVLRDQKVLSTKEQWDKLLSIIPDDVTRKSLSDSFDEYRDASPREKWELLTRELDALKKTKSKAPFTTLHRDIVFQYTYPRIDTNVSIGLNHLLKSPFCVHPKTGRVCVPIDPEHADEFNPLEVPTLQSLVREIEDFDRQNPETEVKKVPDWKKTSIRPYIDYLREFVKGMSEDVKVEQKIKREEQEKEMEF